MGFCNNRCNNNNIAGANLCECDNLFLLLLALFVLFAGGCFGDNYCFFLIILAILVLGGTGGMFGFGA